jgi:hypothetical protein
MGTLLAKPLSAPYGEPQSRKDLHMASNSNKSEAQESGSNNKKSKGQKRSQERGSATNNKKNPGKRPSQGGN